MNGAFPVLAILVYRNGGFSSLRLYNPQAVWWRGIIAFLTTLFVTLSYVKLPLAEAAALIFINAVIYMQTAVD